MSMPAIPLDLGRRLCEALGFDPSLVLHLTLHVDPADVPRVDAVLLIDEPAGAGVTSVLRHFELIPHPLIIRADPDDGVQA